METEQDWVACQALADRLSVLGEQNARLATELAELRAELATLTSRRDHYGRTAGVAEGVVTAYSEPSLQIVTEGGGVYVASGWGSGLYAESRAAPAVLASSLDSHGIHAVGGGVRGGLDRTPQPCGVFAEGGSGPGVYATSAETAIEGVSPTGYGASLAGGTAPLHLAPAATAGAPMAGDHRPGALYVDADAVLWLCVAGGTPGTWCQVVVQ